MLEVSEGKPVARDIADDMYLIMLQEILEVLSLERVFELFGRIFENQRNAILKQSQQSSAQTECAELYS